MPAAAELTAEQAARVAAGRCACGCGLELPTVITWGGRREVSPGAITAGHPCRSRLYRARVAAGKVVSREARRLEALRLEAAELRARAADCTRRAAELTAEGARYTTAARRLEAEAAGQLSIFNARDTVRPGAEVSRSDPDPCPTCGEADPDRPCRSARGNPLPKRHAARASA